MFTRLPLVLKEYLENVGGLNPTDLGPRKAPTVSVVEQQRLNEKLEKESRVNNRLVVCITVLHFLIFILAAVLVIYHRDSPWLISSILGGSLLSLLGVIKGLSQLWREKNAIDMLRTILPNLPPDQAVKVIQSVYFASMKQGASSPKRRTSNA
jgi:hypothetical protein